MVSELATAVMASMGVETHHRAFDELCLHAHIRPVSKLLLFSSFVGWGFIPRACPKRSLCWVLCTALH
jgi:hypothetical protein